MKAKLIIPDGYERVTTGYVKKVDLVFDPHDMEWIKYEVTCPVRDCFYVIRKVDSE